MRAEDEREEFRGRRGGVCHRDADTHVAADERQHVLRGAALKRDA
jgi:hypothetical protein